MRRQVRRNFFRFLKKKKKITILSPLEEPNTNSSVAPLSKTTESELFIGLFILCSIMRWEKEPWGFEKLI